MRHLPSIPFLLLALGMPVPAPIWAGEAPPAVPQPAESQWTMPAAERQAIDAVVERAIAAGVPDAKGGTFLHGTISYEIVQKFGNTTHRQKQTAQGLHLRLADGRLLLNLRWVMPTTGEGALDISGLETVAPDKLSELGTKHPNFARWNAQDPEQHLKKYFAEAELPKVRACNTPAAQGLILLAMGNTGDLAIPTIVMLRMQVPGAELLAVSCAGHSLWNEEGTSFIQAKPTPLMLMPSDDQRLMWQERNARVQAQRGLTVPDPARILRQGVVGYFIGSLLDQRWQWHRPSSAVTLPPDKVVEAAQRMLDDADPGVVGLRDELKRLAQRSALPTDIDAKADLATILQWWSEPISRQNRSDDQMEGMLEHLDQMPAEHRQQMMGQVMMARLSKTTIGDLVALVGDPRPSRWLDQNRTRTVGDNALRALAMNMGVDPRILLGRDVKAPWTTEERAATVAALKEWWAANRNKPLSEMMAGALGVMSLPDLAALVQKTADKERGPLLADIAKRWAAKAPKNPDPVALGTILNAAKAGKELDAVVTPWPVTGRIRTLLAAWHLEHGNAAPFDALLADAEKVLQKPPVPAKGSIQTNSDAADDAVIEEFDVGFGDEHEFSREIYDTLRIVTRHPTPDRLTRLMTLVSMPPKDDNGERLFGCISALAWGGYGDGLNSWWGDREDQMRVVRGNDDNPDLKVRARAAIPLVLNGLLLKDQRPAPKDLVDQYAHYNQNDDEDEGGKKKEKKPLAQDLRLADLAALIFPNQSWNLGIEDLAGEQAQNDLRALKMDLTADRATRDQVITKQRAIIAAALPLALKAANLPTAVPGVTDAAPTATGADAPVF